MRRRIKYVDLQVNGYAGVDFNGDDLQAENLHGCCEQLKRDGVLGILATIITDDVNAMERRIARIADLREEVPLAADTILGLHIEGPFISKERGYVGAHPAGHVIPADPLLMERLLSAARGLTRIVTLAPEMDPGFRVTQMLAERGIVVSAGHCHPTIDCLVAAIDAGLSMFTHLGNGCPMVLHRHDNIIQQALSLSDRLWISFIADGAHVDFPALRNYLKCVGWEHAVIVTDAISAAGLSPGRFTLGSQTVDVADDLVPRAKDGSHFVGSACTMDQMARNLREYIGLSDDEVDTLCVKNPRRVLDSVLSLRI